MRELKDLQQELEDLRERVNRQEKLEAQLTEKFEKKHILGSDLNLTPGAKAVLAENIRGRILSWISLFALAGSVGLYAGYKQFNDSFENKIEDKVQTEVKDRIDEKSDSIDLLINSVFSEALLEFKSAEEKVEVLNKLTQLVGDEDKLKADLEALKNNLERSTALIERIKENAEQVESDKSAYLEKAQELEGTLTQGVISNPDFKSSIIDALSSRVSNDISNAVDNNSKQIERLEGQSSWTKLIALNVTDFDFTCDYKIEISENKEVRYYPAAYIQKDKLFFNFKGTTYFRINSHYVATDLLTYESSGDAKVPERNGDIYERCL